MKRSEVNKAIRHTIKVLEENSFLLPPFAYWTMDEWRERGPKLDNIKAIGLGWDITDYGTGDFDHIGSVLFTLRNGSLTDPKAGTPYAEKIILLKHETKQEIPFHFHKMKTEDIINRGGGILVLELYNSLSDGGLDRESEMTIKMDGLVRTFPPGAIVEIEKGGSITLPPGLQHRFWAKRGAGDLVVGEVSSINDDNTDNVFLEVGRRFSEIEEDEAAFAPLCNEYGSI